MRTLYIWIFLIVFVGAIGAFYLIPTKEDIALIQLKGDKYQSARAYYQGQYDKGIRTPDILIPLSTLDEREGKLDKAIALMQEYLKAHPNDTSALEKISELYRLNQQYDHYFHALLTLNQYQTKNKWETLSELAEWYQNHNETAPLYNTLQELIATGHADESDYQELASLAAQKKDYEKAYTLLKIRRRQFPKQIMLSDVLFEVWLAIQISPAEGKKAVDQLANYLIEKNKPAFIQYSLGVINGDNPELTPLLIDRLKPIIEKNPQLVIAALQTQWNNPGEKKILLPQLLKLYAADPKNPTLQNMLFNTYIENNDDDRLMEMIHQIDPANIDPRDIINLVLLAQSNQNPSLAKEMEHSLGTSFLKIHPTLSVALAIGADETDAQEKLDALLKSASLTQFDRYSLLKVASMAKFNQEALTLGSQLPPYAGLEDFELMEVAQAYIQMGHAEDLYPMLEKSSSKIGERTTAPALAMLDISLGHPEKVEKWLNEQKNFKDYVLGNLYTTAISSKEYPLAFTLANLRQHLYPSKENEADYAFARVETGDVEEGLSFLRHLYLNDPKAPFVDRDFFPALLSAAKQNPTYDNELLTFMTEREKRGKVPIYLQQDFVHAYLDVLHDESKGLEILQILSKNSSPAIQNMVFNTYLEKGYDALLIDFIHKIPVKNIDETGLLNLSYNALIHHKPALAQEMKSALGKDYLIKHPVIATAFAIGAQDPDARKQLDSLLQNAVLSRNESLGLLKLASAAKYNNEVLALGERLPPYNGMEDYDLMDIAYAYIQINKAKVLDDLLEKNLPKIGKKKADPALYMLDISLGRPKKVADWLAHERKVDEFILGNLYSIAEQSNEFPLALYVAKRRNHDYPSAENEADYALALVQVGKIEKGLEILGRIYNQFPKAPLVDRDYFPALVLAAQRNPLYAKALNNFMSEREKQGPLPIDLQEGFVSAYLNILHDHQKAAQLLQALSQSPLSDVQNMVFTSYLDSDQDQLLIDYIHHIPAVNIEEKSIITLSLYALLNDKPLLAQEFKKALGSAYLKAHPFIDTALSVGAQEKEGRQKLDELMKTHLSQTDRYDLLRIAAAAKYKEETLALGSKLPPFDDLEEEQLFNIALSYIQIKEPGALYAMFAKANLKKAEAAIAALDIALGNSKKAADWLHHELNIQEYILSDLYTIANDNKEYRLALYIAKKRELKYPSIDSKADFAFALVQAGEIDHGLSILQNLFEKEPLGSYVDRDYFPALVLAAKNNSSYKPQLCKFMDIRPKLQKMSTALLRDFAYTYLEVLQNFSKAEMNFKILAENEHPQEPDVQTLVSLWGPKPSPDKVLWIAERANCSPPKDLAYWLQDLISVGAYTTAIEIFQCRMHEQLDIDAYFAYMDALVYEKRKYQLRCAIDQTLPVVHNKKQLEKLAGYAEDSEYLAARTHIWEMIASITPQDPTVWKNLAIAAFAQNDYYLTSCALGRFFRSSCTPYEAAESLFELGKVMEKRRYFKSAYCLYSLALNAIQRTDGTTPTTYELASQIFYNLDMPDSALEQMWIAYELSSRDSDIGASYANLLMDTGYLRPAKCFLRRK